MPEFETLHPGIWNNAPDLTAAFSLRNPHYNPHDEVPGLNLGGNISEEQRIRANRGEWLNTLNASPGRLVLAKQIHSNHVAWVTEPGIYEDTDGFVTDRPELWLAIQVADCAAVLLADRTNRIIGACHAGWRGAVSGIVGNTIEAMKNGGAQPEHMEAFISPCICQDHFEVGEEVASEFPESVVDFEHYEKPHPDLKSFITIQLREAGIKQSATETSDLCTIEDYDKLYSHRLQNGHTGRMMAVIALRASS